MAINTIQTFALPSPYEQQLMEAKRRQLYAEMLQNQANQSIIPQQGRVASKISPLAGVAQMLSAGLAGYQRRKGDEAQQAASQADIQNATSFMDRLQAGKPADFSPDQALAASMDNAPTQGQMTPYSGQERKDYLERGWLTGSPTTKALATALMAQKPERNLKLADINPKDFTPESLSAAIKADDAGLLQRTPEKPEKPAAPHTVGGMVWNPQTNKFEEIPGYAAQAARVAAAGRGPEPLVQIMQNGQPVYVPRSQAIGKQAYTPASLKQELADANREQQQRQLAITTQDTLDTAASLLAHPGRIAATGASHYRSLIPGTDAKDFAAKLETFKAQTFLPMVSALKGMGQLSDAEGKKISAAVGALDPSMSEKAFEKELKHVIDFLYQKGVASGLSIVKPDSIVSGGTTGEWSSNGDIHSQADAILRNTQPRKP